MFAFALWDAAEQTLVLVRDRFGKKPMHYAALPDGRLVFGSEIKSLLKVQGLDRRLDPEAVEDFFTYGYVPDPKTIYAAIRKLPAAHALIARRGQPFELLRYWNLLDDFPVTHSGTDAEAEMVEMPAPFREASADFRCRSGRAVVGRSGFQRRGLADGRFQDAPVSTFSIGFEEQDYDESPYAKAVSARYHTAITATSWIRPISVCYLGCRASMTSPLATFLRFPLLPSASWRGNGQSGAHRRWRRRSPGGLSPLCLSRRPDAGRGFLARCLARPIIFALSPIFIRMAPAAAIPRAKTTFRELSLSPAEAYLRMVSALPCEMRLQFLSGDFRKSLGGL